MTAQTAASVPATVTTVMALEHGIAVALSIELRDEADQEALARLLLALERDPVDGPLRAMLRVEEVAA